MTINVFYNKCLDLQRSLPNCKFAITTSKDKEGALTRVEVRIHYFNNPKSVIVGVDRLASEERIDKSYKLLLV